MNIHILYGLKSGPWGGGNQFLKALRNELIKKDKYVDSINNADAIIFDSYHDMFRMCWYAFIHPRKKRIYRLGPVFHLHRKGWKWKLIDRLVACIANWFADVVIFQSEWSHQQAISLGFNKKKRYSVIINAVDESIFYKKQLIEKDPSMPIRLMYASWSTNPNKGFSYIAFLDKHLDVEKYHMTFVGNAPVPFETIEVLPAMNSTSLAAQLRNSDIFIFPSKDDACSNALLEALSCGIPAVALDSGGNAELVKDGGVLFQNEQELLNAIDTVSGQLLRFSSNISIKSMSAVAEEYITAIHDSIK